MATEREAMMLAVEALQMAHAGLEWYRDMHSDSVNASDDEADEKIGAALVALDEAMLAAPSNADSVYSGLALTEGGPGATKLLRRLDDALRTAWDARTLPACVIPADLAQEVGAFLRQARDTLGETARSNEKTPASGSSTAVSGEEARDAARYRGMRATLIGGDMHNFARMIALVACFFDSSDKFDAAIDSALQASNGLAAPSGSGSEGEGVKEVPRG
jgi:hypothetical protein